MVTIPQIRMGIMRYIQTDMLPKLSGLRKAGLAVAAELYAMQADRMIQDFLQKPGVQYMNLQDEAGNIDLERVQEVIRKSIPAGETYAIPIPVLGDYNIDRNDLERLITYIKEAH